MLFLICQFSTSCDLFSLFFISWTEGLNPTVAFRNSVFLLRISLNVKIGPLMTASHTIKKGQRQYHAAHSLALPPGFDSSGSLNLNLYFQQVRLSIHDIRSQKYTRRLCYDAVQVVYRYIRVYMKQNAAEKYQSLLCECCLLMTTSLTCISCVFPTESEARALAKERQKKDNHNLSKFLVSFFKWSINNRQEPIDCIFVILKAYLTHSHNNGRKI